MTTNIPPRPSAKLHTTRPRCEWRARCLFRLYHCLPINTVTIHNSESNNDDDDYDVEDEIDAVRE
jgi:hypothetical protein